MQARWTDASDPRFAKTSIVLGGGLRTTSPTPSDSGKNDPENSEEAPKETEGLSNQVRISGGSDFYEEPPEESA